MSLQIAEAPTTGASTHTNRAISPTTIAEATADSQTRVTAKEPYGSVIKGNSLSRQLLHSRWVGFHRRRKRAVRDLRLALELGLTHPRTGERVELCPNALRVAEHCLLKYDNDIGGMFAAQGDIAQALSLSRQKVNKHLGALVEAGIFTSESRNREGVYAQRAHMGGRTTNRYRFCWDRILAAIKTARRALRKYTSKVPFWADNMTGHRGEAKPEPSFADLIRKYHGDEEADAYLAAHMEGEECLKVERVECSESKHGSGTRSRAWRNFATSRLGLVRVWRRLVVALRSCVNRGSSSKPPADMSSLPRFSPGQPLPHSAAGVEW
jgi:hypothetical protein